MGLYANRIFFRIETTQCANKTLFNHARRPDAAERALNRGVKRIRLLCKPLTNDKAWGKSKTLWTLILSFYK